MLNKWKNSALDKEKIKIIQITNTRDRRGGITTDPTYIKELKGLQPTILSSKIGKSR